jgi:hypothetical protein
MQLHGFAGACVMRAMSCYESVLLLGMLAGMLAGHDWPVSWCSNSCKAPCTCGNICHQSCCFSNAFVALQAVTHLVDTVMVPPLALLG